MLSVHTKIKKRARFSPFFLVLLFLGSFLTYYSEAKISFKKKQEFMKINSEGNPSEISAACPRSAYFRATSTIIVSASIPFIASILNENFRSKADIALFVPFCPWQILNLLSFAINMFAVTVPGRVDQQQAAPQTPKDIRFFTPAGWAFAIWAPIFLGEAFISLYQCLPYNFMKESRLFSNISPYWVTAMSLQSIWCSAFRPWAVDNGFLWIPASLLTATGLALFEVNRIMQLEAKTNLGVWGYIFLSIPVSLHFGWISAASLVSWNGVLASTKMKIEIKLACAFFSAYLATGLGAFLSFYQRDPIYAFVICWALAAVADKKGWEKLNGAIDDATLKALAISASGGSIFLFVTSFLVAGMINFKK